MVSWTRPFTVESIAATCRVRYSYPDPADSLCSVIVTSPNAAPFEKTGPAPGKVAWVEGYGEL